MSNYDEWFKKGYELLQIAEGVNGKRAIGFLSLFINEKEFQSNIDKLRQQLEMAKQKHEARDKQNRIIYRDPRAATPEGH